MKRLTLSRFYTALIIGAISTNVLAQNLLNKPFSTKKVDNKAVITYFHRLLPTTTINGIYSTPYPDTYALLMGSNIVYGNTHSSYLMAGHLFNVYSQDDITVKLQRLTTPNTATSIQNDRQKVDNQRIDEVKIDLAKINIADAVVAKSPNKVNKKLIIFIDPDCPYCKLLEHQISERQLNNKADIYYMMMPLSIHPESKGRTVNILCSTTPVDTLNEYMLKNNTNPSFKAIDGCNVEPVLERTGSTARELGINGTPAIITGKGELIMGDDIEAIENYLNSVEKK